LRISVIIPVLNEAAAIRDFVFHLRDRLRGAEIVIVDGGSEDETWDELEAIRDRFSLRLLRAARGRATQMNAGVIASKGDILLFLHADSRLPSNCAPAIAALLANEKMIGGCFRLRFPRREWIYRISDSLGNCAVDLFRIALGDHGIFCRREVFFKTGGYPLLPLMEDAKFYRTLQRFGRVRQLPLEVETSPRRYEQLGRYRTTLFYLFILTLYLLGVRPTVLARYHRRFTGMAGVRPAELWGRRASRPPSSKTTGETSVINATETALLQ
jgi:rSAM/selenodomain-associated transferase 2